MSWGTDFKADVYIRNKVFQDKCQLEEEIKDNEDNMKEIEKRISMMSIAQPSSILGSDESDDPVFYISRKCKEELEYYKELATDNVLLGLLLENWEEYDENRKKIGKELRNGDAE